MSLRDWLPQFLRPELQPSGEPSGPPQDRIVLIPGADGHADLLSDSQTGEIHRVLERAGQKQIDAVPIVSRLLRRDLRARNVALLEVASEHFVRQTPLSANHFLGAHFVLDERARHIYRVFVTPRCCLAERLWGSGLDEVHERPLGPALLSWSDECEERARAASGTSEQVVPHAASWGLSFVSLQTEASSDIERRLFACGEGLVRHHLRPVKGGTEGAIEIEWQGRIILTFEEDPGASGKRPARLGPALKALREVGEVPF